jgi:hypothetical protein
VDPEDKPSKANKIKGSSCQAVTIRSRPERVSPIHKSTPAAPRKKKEEKLEKIHQKNLAT